MLVTGGLNDPRVQYWEPAKWVAKLRAMKTDRNLLVLKMQMGAGHSGPSGRYDAWRDEAFVLAFLLDQLGTSRSEPTRPVCLIDIPVMTQLPSGTETFLFTDVEGSTRLSEEHPDAMQGAFARHDDVAREAIESHRGYVVKTTGDGFHADVRDRLGCARRRGGPRVGGRLTTRTRPRRGRRRQRDPPLESRRLRAGARHHRSRRKRRSTRRGSGCAVAAHGEPELDRSSSADERAARSRSSARNASPSSRSQAARLGYEATVDLARYELDRVISRTGFRGGRAAVRDGHLPLHRRGRFDAPLGGEPRRDAPGPGAPRRDAPRRNRVTRRPRGEDHGRRIPRRVRDRARLPSMPRWRRRRALGTRVVWRDGTVAGADGSAHRRGASTATATTTAAR